MPLRGTTPKKEDGKRLKILLYGASGVGKTTSAIQIPNSYIIDSEAGSGAYWEEIADKGSKVFHSANFRDVEKEIDVLLTESHPFTTVVIDSLTKVYANICEHWDARFAAARSRGNDNLDDWGIRFWTKTKKEIKRLSNKLLALDMNVIVTCHEKDKYNGQNIVGICADIEKSIPYDYDFAIRLVKSRNKYIALTDKTRLPLNGPRFPDQFEWKYDNLVKFYGEEKITRPANQVDNKNNAKVDEPVDNTPAVSSEDIFNDKLELLTYNLKKNKIGAKDFKDFLKESAKWDVPSITKLDLKQLTILIDNWEKKVLPRFLEFTKPPQKEDKSEDKTDKSEDKSEDKKGKTVKKKCKTKGEAISTIELLMDEWKVNPESFMKHLNIGELKELDLNGLNSIFENFTTIIETIQ